MTNQEILDLPFTSSDVGDTTLRNYFRLLLTTLWDEGEGFSGKRPFGNSGWDYDVYIPLIKAGAVRGTIDIEGYIDDIDKKAANKLVFELIDEALKP